MKLLLLTASLLFAANIAYAQTTELTLKVSPTEADTIWKGLRKLPVEEVETLMAKIRQQVAEQTTPKPEPKPEQSKEPGKK